MPNLNATIKLKIIANAIEKANVNKDYENLQKRRAKWANDVRLDAIGDIDKKLNWINKRINKAVEGLPSNLITNKSLFRKSYSILVNVAGLRFIGYFCGKRYEPLSEERVYNYTCRDHTLNAKSLLTKEFNDIEKEQERIDELKDIMTSQIKAVLCSVRTVKKLLHVWPEVKELLPIDLSGNKTNLPILKTEDLNNMIGLPSK